MKKSTTLPWSLRAVRAALRKLNTFLSRRYERAQAPVKSLDRTEVPDERARAAEAALRKLDLLDEKARTYFDKHLPRLAHTLSLVPAPRSRPQSGGEALELGCYMQITPFIVDFCGYKSICGAHYGPAGTQEKRTARVGGKRFEATVDLFDAERDLFPYPDGAFELVLCCELIEHLQFDPMHMLREAHRVLEEGGRLLITTPNAGSLTSVAHALHGYDNPQIYSKYSMPDLAGAPNPPHVREYTAFELRDLAEYAGFEVEMLVTEPIAEFAVNLPMWNFLEEHGYNTLLRGEQTYCLAVKRAGLPVTRYPEFLYAS